jgi:A/G-specific adenine glycosylase
MLSTEEMESFRADLLRWFGVHRRDLPWRRTRDPYAIWISEIMLQQTRVAAVVPYYERFLARFPDLEALAVAPESDLLAHWAGLGYYYRARNLQKAAQAMAADGEFPSEHDRIRRLPGVGDYTSAAVASIAFNHPHAAVDGNVLRVLSRVFADPTDIASARGKKNFAFLAGAILDREQPGLFNQAMMELGATVCLPRSPQCLLCPVSRLCQANRTGRQREFPFKLSKKKRVEEERTLFWIEHDSNVLLWQRGADSRLMPGFWELPERANIPSAVPIELIGSFLHGITFHHYRFEVMQAEAADQGDGLEWIPVADLHALPVSTVLRKAARLVERQRSATRLVSNAAPACG